MNPELKQLVKEYMNQYPDAVNPIVFSQTWDEEQLIDILKKRQGRQIDFYYLEGSDQASYVYLPLV